MMKGWLFEGSFVSERIRERVLVGDSPWSKKGICRYLWPHFNLSDDIKAPEDDRNEVSSKRFDHTD